MPKVTVRCNAEPDCRQLRCLYALPIRTRHYQLLGIKGETPPARLLARCALSALAANWSITAGVDGVPALLRALDVAVFAAPLAEEIAPRRACGTRSAGSRPWATW